MGPGSVPQHLHDIHPTLKKKTEAPEQNDKDEEERAASRTLVKNGQ
jgi:hypothetical protein